ncbi:MAG TPA: sorbosone dehydrogenase family protein, partial [Luteimonas sp.]|nr:sorbosone dehydrogenase family protein [Luteimonas sp.]
MPRPFRCLLLLALGAALCGCGESARLAVREGMGPAPRLPEPVRTLLPTVNVAEAQPWEGNAGPTPARP